MKQGMQMLVGVACLLAPLALAAGPLKLDAPMGAPLARAMLARWGYGATDASVAALATQTPRAMVQRGWREPSRVAPAVSASLDALADAPPLAERLRFQPSANTIADTAIEKNSSVVCRAR